MMKDEELLAKRLSELSRQAFHRGIITYTDFLNLNEQSILHALPKNSLYTEYVLFGGYDGAERQMAAFLPDDALSLRCRYGAEQEREGGMPPEVELFSDRIAVLEISPLHAKYADELTHRDYLGALMNLGVIKGTVSSVRLDALLALAFSSSRSSLTGLIGAGKVFVNGRLTTSNGCHIREQDIISVRGMGKFRFAGQLSVTKKNRICVLIHKYI